MNHTNTPIDTVSPQSGGVQALDYDALDRVVAGLDCSTSLKVAHVYMAAAQAMRATGQSDTAAHFEGVALGVFRGGCLTPA